MTEKEREEEERRDDCGEESSQGKGRIGRGGEATEGGAGAGLGGLFRPVEHCKSEARHGEDGGDVGKRIVERDGSRREQAAEPKDTCAREMADR